MIAHADAEVGRCAIIVANQTRKARAIEGAPGPADIAATVSVQPRHQCVNKAMSAIILADLSHNYRDLLEYRCDLAIVASGIAARIEVIDMPCRCNIAQWIGRFIGKPLRQVVGPCETAEHEHIRRTGAAYRVHE